MRVADPALHERRRTEILEAAARVFVEKGFHQATTADLAKEAGVSMGLLYRYFKNKEDLVLQFAGRERDETLRRIEAFAEADDWASSLDGLIDVLVAEAFQVEYARLTFEVVAEASRNQVLRERLMADDLTLRRALTAALRRHQARGTLGAELNAAMVAEVVTAVFDGLLYRTLMNPQVNRSALRKTLKAFLQAALTTGPT
jgi:AcrR family transcriptional regulator